jgi:hypothetical protein
MKSIKPDQFWGVVRLLYAVTVAYALARHRWVEALLLIGFLVWAEFLRWRLWVSAQRHREEMRKLHAQAEAAKQEYLNELAARIREHQEKGLALEASPKRGSTNPPQEKGEA